MRQPASTYRIQLGPDFGFAEATELVPYLDALGITDIYLSPILAPESGSTHGYDVVDPTRLNPALGTPAQFKALGEAARARGMGVLVDIVPNHMAASTENPWWRDVLATGAASEFADFFDIDWHPPWPGCADRVLLPVLGDHYAEVLERQELSVHADDTGFSVHYFDQAFPLSPTTCAEIDAETLDALNSDPEALDALLSRQNFQLRYWKSERYELNYRRFFNISGMVGVRVEQARVRSATHARLQELWDQGLLTGLRIDHIDGLRQPQAYLEWLQTAFAHEDGSAPYVLVEKILAPDERLPEEWPVAGTTGYEFSNELNGVFVDPDGQRKLNRIYAEFTGRDDPFRTVVYRKKRFILDWLFRAELDRLSWQLAELASRVAAGRDLAGGQLKEALAVVSACMPVYRTYIDGPRVAEPDRAPIARAVDEARSRDSDLDDEGDSDA